MENRLKEGMLVDTPYGKGIIVGFNEKSHGGKLFPHVLINGDVWVMLYDFGEWSLITKPKKDYKGK